MAKYAPPPDDMWCYVYAHPAMSQVAAQAARERGYGPRCSMFVSDLVARNQPVFEFEQINGRERSDMLAQTKDRFLEWYKQQYKAPRPKNEVQLPMPHPRQKSIIYSKKRFKVMVCGRRFGKTTAALIAAVLRAVQQDNQVVYYVAPTYRQAKQIAWSMLLEFVGNAYARKNEQELWIEFPNGSRIYLKGSENPDALRGAFCDLVILDEWQDQRELVWTQIIQPMIADRKGEVWFIGTPKGFNHFQKRWQDAHDGKLGPDWGAYRLTTYDNPHIPREEIERARRTDAREFAQEYMAEFVQFSGLVYPQFQPARHVRQFNPKLIEGVDLAGIDVGADHPTACLLARVTSGGSVYVWAEHYQADASVKTHAAAIKELVPKGGKPRKWYIDPSAKQFAKDLRSHGIPTVPAVNDRVYGISELRALLEQDKLVIHPRCTNLIYEFQHHVYKEHRGDAKDRKDVDKEVKKVDDDALDALRYLVASHFKGRTYADVEPHPPADVWIPPGTTTSFDKDTLTRYTGQERAYVAPEFTHLEN